MTVPAAADAIAFDARGLDALRRQSANDPKAAIREAAGQFEALFMQQLLKSMRAAIPKSGMFEGPGQETYTAMLDEQLAKKMGTSPGGLADVIARQMSRQIEGSSEAGAAGRAGGTVGGTAGGTAGDRASVDRGIVRGSTLAHAGARSWPSSAGGLPGDEGSPPTRVESVTKAAPAARPELPALSEKQLAFVRQMWPHAQAAEAKSGVPAAFVVGQAALESGWGRRDIRGPEGEPTHNLFGIKATASWSGKSVPVLTTEYVDGVPRKVIEKFRAYDNHADAFADWASLMGNSSRYAKVLEADNASEFANRIQSAGYATDPRYARKLEGVIAQAERAAAGLQIPAAPASAGRASNIVREER